MGLVIVEGVARYTVRGRWSSGRRWANVFDYQIDTTGSPTGRADRVPELADDIIQNYQSQILPNLTNNVTVDDVAFIDLDDEDGITGTRPFNGGVARVGGLAGLSMPPNVAWLVHKRTTSARGARAGRFYLPGVQEAAVTEDGAGEGAGIVTLQTDLNDFLANTQNVESVGGVNQTWSRMVVSHVPPQDPDDDEAPRVGSFTLVTALSLDPTIATQRRRLRG